LPLNPGEISYHNAFPVDADNAIFLETTEKMIRLDWDGSDLSLTWTAAYDFVGDGPTGTLSLGSGTTPTLIGWEQGEDKLVVLADGHNRNNLVAFWRDELPTGWTGVPGMDIRFADSIALPYAVNLNNGFQSIENSPAAYGYELVCTQYNGFFPNCNTTKGVQKIRWNTAADSFEVAWATDSVNFNGVPTYSSATNLVYGSGRESDCNYYFYGLDWDSGDVLIRQILGNTTMYNDQGNNSIIDENNNLYFSTQKGVAIIKSLGSATGLPVGEDQLRPESFTLYQNSPNPFNPTTTIRYRLNKAGYVSLRLYDLQGKEVRRLVERNQEAGSHQVVLNAAELASGTYFYRITVGEQSATRRMILMK